MVKMRDGKAGYETLIDISSIPALLGIKTEGKEVVVGATTTMSEIGESSLIRCYSAMTDSIATFGTALVRNLGTIGGNLCNASPAADLAPPLFVLGAKVIAVGPTGQRRINVEDFFLGPSKTALRSDELVLAVALPEPSGGSAFVKFGRRAASVLSVVSAAAMVELRGGKIRDTRLSLGAVAPTPVRARKTEKAILGLTVKEAIVAAARAVEEDIRPITDQRASSEYRKKLSAEFVVRVIRLAASRAMVE